MCLRRESDFMREDIAGWINYASEYKQERDEYKQERDVLQQKSDQWTKIALQMNMLLQNVKRLSSADHVKDLCDQVEYMDLPEELTADLYNEHDVGFTPYDVPDETA